MSRRFAFYNTEMDGKICSMLHDGDDVMNENDAEIVLNNLWDAYKDEVERIAELEGLVKESFEEGYYEGVHFPSPLNCKWDESWAKRDLAILKEQGK
jgi:hypothetical protein